VKTGVTNCVMQVHADWRHTVRQKLCCYMPACMPNSSDERRTSTIKHRCTAVHMRQTTKRTKTTSTGILLGTGSLTSSEN
jgi:hypothetical protein